MKMRNGLPYMIIGGAMVVAYIAMRNTKVRNMVNNAVNNIRRKNMSELEDMM